MSGASPTLYGKLWENLSHKGINTPFGSSQLPHLVDPTTQKTEFPVNYYRQGLQSQIVNRSHAEASIIFQGIKLPQPVGGTAEIKEDIRGSDLFSTSITSLSDVDIVLSDRETGTNYWQGFQSQVVNLSHVDVNVHFWRPRSSQLVSEAVQVKEDVRASDLFHSYMMLPSDVDVVIPRAETGEYYYQNLQSQVVNPSHADTNIHLWRPQSSQLVSEAAQVKEDVRASDLFHSYTMPPSDMDIVLSLAEAGTAITVFTQPWKLYQAWKQKLEISEQFDTLAQREDNWDGHGSPKPTDLTLAHAKVVMDSLLDSVISAGYRCDSPSISSDEDGNVTVAWYEDERQLHLQIGEHEAEFFKVWGTNIDTEMDVGFLKSDNYLTLWEWLIDESQ